MVGRETQPRDSEGLPAKEENGSPYKFGQRALNNLESEYQFYYEIEVIKEIPFKGQEADIIPWFGQVGNGKQMKWNIPDASNGFPKTWNDLVTEGYIKVTIKNSVFPNLINTVL